MITLYRPVDSKELQLIAASAYKAFPPRLLSQDIFYPVLDEQYAIQIARDWNVKFSEDHKGYVTRFNIKKDYIEKHNVHNVGSVKHREYWIPANELEKFNSNIVGQIDIIHTFTDNGIHNK